MDDLPTPLPTTTPNRIIVIGAGMSGLTAALELESAGHEVVVVEARDRPGGRVLTMRDADGFAVAEAGAGRIPESHKWVTHYIRKMGLETEPVYPEGLSPVLYLRNRRIALNRGCEPNWQFLTESEQALGVDGLISLYMRPGVDRVRASGAIDTPRWPPEELQDLDRMTAREHLAERGLSSAAIDLLLAGAWPDTISALTLFRVLSTYDRARIRKINGGNDRLPSALVAKLGAPIRYRSAVRAISQHGHGVEVTVERADGRHVIKGDAVVCTIPFSLLSDVAFDPPLSVAKQQIVAEMRYATAIKVAFVTNARPWERDRLSGFAQLDTAAEIWNARPHHTGTGSVLQLYQQGARAVELDKLSSGERIASTLATVERVFPGTSAATQAVFEHSWQHDPWAKGAYAVAGPGQTYAWKGALARAEGRIHFAGEHTYPEYGAWIEGAVRSGYRAAAEVSAIG